MNVNSDNSNNNSDNHNNMSIDSNKYEMQPMLYKRSSTVENSVIDMNNDIEIISTDSPESSYGISVVLFESRLNILLLAAPLAIYGAYEHFEILSFVTSLITLIPLAAMLGFVTEQLALHSNSIIGGLMNATFGNATELIICFFALKENMPCVVQQSLLGSILSNELLVLGTAFLLGGVRYQYQTFNRDLMATSCGLLFLSIIGLLIPTTLQISQPDHVSDDLAFSRFTAILLLLVYFSYLFFQLRTHIELFNDVPTTDANIGVSDVSDNINDDDDDTEEIVLSWRQCVGWLTIITLAVSLFSEFLVTAIDGASSSLGISEAFIAVIIIPIVGNAAEHASAVTCCMKNKMDLAIGIAIGSSTQIALFGIPTMVIVGWIMNIPLSLNFSKFQSMTVFMATLVLAVSTTDGRSHWLRGLLFIVAYILLAAGFWYLQDSCNNT